MKNYILTALFCLISISVFSQTPTDKIFYDKQWKVTTIKDSIAFYRILKKENDKYIVNDYYQSGILQMNGTCSSLNPDIREGVFIYYHENGQISGQGEYVKDKKEGKWKMYDYEGKISREGIYIQGNEEGKWTWYFPKGNVINREGEFRNGKKEGKWIWYFPNGKVDSEGEYRNDKKEGKWIIYKYEGQMSAEGSYIQDNKEGKWIWYFPNGKISSEGELHNGKREGKFQIYSKDGTLEGEGFYFHDKKNGIWNTFYPDGNIRSIQNFKENKLNGDLTTYYPSKVIKRTDKYLNDTLISGKCFSVFGQDTTYFPYEQKASFKGGLSELKEFLNETIKYPEQARTRNIQGRVIVRFAVDKTGQVMDAEIKHSIDPLLDKEALRVVSKMPLWNCGLIDGIPAETTFALPVVFKIEQ